MFAATAVMAVEVSVVASDRGWYNSEGFHDPTSLYYNAGGPFGATELRNFFVFDLTNLPAREATSAVLRLRGGSSHQPSGAPESYQVSVYSGDRDALVNGTGGLNAFNAMGTGIPVGTFTSVVGDPAVATLIPLSQEFLSTIPYGGFLVLSGRVTTLPGSMFSNVAPQDGPRLIITDGSIPLPTAAGMATVCLLAIAGRRRRHAT